MSSTGVIVIAVIILFLLFGGFGLIFGILRWTLAAACVVAIAAALAWKLVHSD